MSDPINSQVLGAPFTGGPKITKIGVNEKSAASQTYDIINSNWYKSLPYGFAFYDIGKVGGDTPTATMYLPISPSNLTVSTNFATNIITTLYGVIEEHSEVRYYNITIQGTTGFAPRFVDTDIKSNNKIHGRTSFKAKGLDLGGFLPEITNTVNQALNTVNEISDTLNGGPSNPTGIDPEQSGYVAFHNLYRFFLKYKIDTTQTSAFETVSQIKAKNLGTAVKRHVHPIQFLNYKDGIKYDCVPLSFTMVRSANNPMLYNYNISLRAFNLRNVNASVQEADRLAELGLGGLDGQSLFSKMTSVAGNASTLISGIL